MRFAGERPEARGMVADFLLQVDPELAAQLGMEVEQIAGIRPLPIGRMRQQAIRRRNEGARKAADKIEATIRDADPQEAEWRQRENEWRDQKRSRRVYRTRDLDAPFGQMIDQGIRERKEAFERTRDRSLDDRSGVDPEKFLAEQAELENLRSMRMSTFLQQTNPLYDKLRGELFNTWDSYLADMRRAVNPDAGLEAINANSAMPASLSATPEGREVFNDLLAEWRSLRSRPAVGPVDAMELVQPIAPLDGPMYEAFPGV